MISVFVFKNDASEEILKRTLDSLKDFPEVFLIGETNLVYPNTKILKQLINPIYATKANWYLYLNAGDVVYPKAYEIYNKYITSFPFVKLFYSSYDTLTKSQIVFSYDIRMLGQTNLIGPAYLIHSSIFPQQPKEEHSYWKELSATQMFYAIPHKLMLKSLK